MLYGTAYAKAMAETITTTAAQWTRNDLSGNGQVDVSRQRVSDARAIIKWVISRTVPRLSTLTQQTQSAIETLPVGAHVKECPCLISKPSPITSGFSVALW